MEFIYFCVQEDECDPGRSICRFDWWVVCGWMLNSVISGAFCFRAPLDFSVFYFWWFLRESRGGGAQTDGRAPFGKDKGILFLGRVGSGVGGT